jgi:predicted Zn-dependent peptidase
MRQELETEKNQILNEWADWRDNADREAKQL